MKQGVLTPGRVRLLLHRGKSFMYSMYPCTLPILYLKSIPFLFSAFKNFTFLKSIPFLEQELLASADMEGVMESEGESLFVGALSALTSLLLTW